MTDYDYNNPNYVSLDEARARIGQAWLLQYRGAGLVSDLIRVTAGGGPHTHSALVERNQNGSLDVLEMREFRGGRALPLEFHARSFRGRIDVFKPNRFGLWTGEWDPDSAVDVMRNLVTRGYGYRGALGIGLRHLPIVWRLYGVSTSDVLQGEEKGVRPFCSHAVALACDLGGNVDPVLRLPHYLVEPSHLTWSWFFEYEFSL